jgi:hypothetical protein
MPHGETVSGLYEFLEGDLYATVELRDTGDGWVSEWWISRNVLGTYELLVVGYLRLPVYGEDLKAATRRIHFIYEEVLNSFATWSGGVADTGAGGDVISARKHCRAHLQKWGEDLSEANKTEHTAALYSFAVEFGVNNPAALIAEVEVLPSVRTVHDRIAYARRIGLLDSYGKGRIKNGIGNGNGSGSGTESSREEEDWDESQYAEENFDISQERKDSILDRILKHGNSGD